MEWRKFPMGMLLILATAVLPMGVDKGWAQLDPGGVPHYFGPYPNYANSPLPTGAVTVDREAEVLVEVWRRHYNRVRPHSTLGYQPPAPKAIAWPKKREIPIETPGGLLH